MNLRVFHVVAAALVSAGLSSNAQAQIARATVPSCDLAPASSGVQQLSSDGRQRTYRLFVPQSYDGRTRLPLVLDMHGSGGTSAGQARTSGFEIVAAREGIIVATLQADGGRWNVPVTDGRADDVTYVSDVIDHVAARVCTDLARVYATGFSGGGRMAPLLACRLNTRIAAIAPVAGLRWPGPCKGRPVPVLTFHGLADPQNPYAGQAAGRGAEWLAHFETLAPTRRVEAARLVFAGRTVEAAEAYARFAGPAEEAPVRLLAARQLAEAGRRAEADVQLRRALAFYRAVGATHIVREAEALLAQPA